MGANIPPNGLHARHQGQHKVPIEVWARLDDDGLEWAMSDFVWVAGAGVGEWELLWARTAGSPASATAIYQTSPGTQVTVSWVHADPKVAEQYRVLRADGSLVGTVASTETSIVDSSPRPLNGSYEVRGVVGGVPADTGTATNVLDLRLQPATVDAVLDGLSVGLTWTHNALGRPDQYKVLRDGVVIATLAGTVTSHTDSAPTRGTVSTYEVRPVLTSIDGLGRTDDIGVPAGVPTSVALTATTSPLSNLRLTWAAPSGGRTGFEVERSTNGTTWTAHESPASDATSSDWSTTVTGYMRVRTLSAGGASAWVQVGPVEPINDLTPPANATITSFRPEASYGRMVLRFTTPNDTDFTQYLVQHRFGTGGWSGLTGWTNAARNAAIAVVGLTISEGQNYRVRVLVRDAKLNQNIGLEAAYTLGPSQIIVNPSGSLSGTYRNGVWRNDGTRSSTELATGWTSSGHNIGCYFYDDDIAIAIAGKTIVSATIEYYRENEGGLGAAVQPLFWTHQLTTRVGAPTLNAHGVAEASRLGSGVARTGTTSGVLTLPAAFIAALQAGTARGLAMYRGYTGSGDPDNYYALLGIGGQSGGSPSRVNGRLTFNSLG